MPANHDDGYNLTMKDRLGHPIYCDQCEQKKAIFIFIAQRDCTDTRGRGIPKGVKINTCGMCGIKLVRLNLKETP